MNLDDAPSTPRRKPPTQFNLSSLPVTPTVPEVSLLLDQNYRPLQPRQGVQQSPSASNVHQGQPTTPPVTRIQEPQFRISSPTGFGTPSGSHQRPALPPRTNPPVLNGVQDASSKLHAFDVQAVEPFPNCRSPPSFQHSPLVTSPAVNEDGPRKQGPVQVDYAANLMLNVEKKLLEQRVKELEEENRCLRDRVGHLESQQNSLQQVKMDALAEQTAACLRLLENLNNKKVQFERSTQTDESSIGKPSEVQQMPPFYVNSPQPFQPQTEENSEDFYNNALKAMQGFFPQRDLKVSVQETTVNQAGATRKNMVMFDTCYLPRVQPVPEPSQRVSDISAHMNQLALKHLSSPEIPPEGLSKQPCMTYYNNLSMSTKQFLEKLRTGAVGQEEKIEEEHEEVFGQQKSRQGSSTDKILDITAIKQQNKLM
ncbi:uncharacterized protein LOC132204189 isoform X1 [Neocloeon triangulifer]|uniref:uncharacterized protein LOC132204189 isoform X1 n=1 Tax=Neocloeon triangulifer TaxID=2078957 RepID=UPI00286F47E7|nr:uncharacterized protein LOC132204189 isoform X1 [Neocloeon triangulifer]